MIDAKEIKRLYDTYGHKPIAVYINSPEGKFETDRERFKGMDPALFEQYPTYQELLMHYPKNMMGIADEVRRLMEGHNTQKGAVWSFFRAGRKAELYTLLTVMGDTPETLLDKMKLPRYESLIEALTREINKELRLTPNGWKLRVGPAPLEAPPVGTPKRASSTGAPRSATHKMTEVTLKTNEQIKALAAKGDRSKIDVLAIAVEALYFATFHDDAI